MSRLWTHGVAVMRVAQPRRRRGPSRVQREPQPPKGDYATASARAMNIVDVAVMPILALSSAFSGKCK